MDNSFDSLFVYGSLKEGFNNHSILKDCKRIGLAEIKDSSFVMYRNDYYPVILKTENKELQAGVSGELYRIPKSLWTPLDILEGYQFELELVNILFTFDRYNIKKTYHETTAYTYVGKESVWAKEFLEGKLFRCPIFNRNRDKDVRVYTYLKTLERLHINNEKS